MARVVAHLTWRLGAEPSIPPEGLLLAVKQGLQATVELTVSKHEKVDTEYAVCKPDPATEVVLLLLFCCA